MSFVADFHIHSKYSRATSKNMDVVHLADWARHKGISVLGTGDFTHHLWLEELKRHLEPLEKKGLSVYKGIHFILSVEISSIFSQGNKVYRVHNIILVPSFKLAHEVNVMLSRHGNLSSDGRPIFGMSCKQLAQELFKISDEIMLIPAHIWTPWFSVFGSNSGFDSLEQAFGKYAERITALETGLSSDPAMNWRLSSLDRYSLVSNSDAHSPQRLGREANVFNCDRDYWQIKEVLEKKDSSKFLYTIEFFPEEGKYHYDGHRNCKQRFHPEETKKHKGICPSCGKALTRGVLNRVDELADRPQGFIPLNAVGYKSLVPLDEIVAAVKGVDKKSKAVEKEYLALINEFGSELDLLINVEEKELFSKLPLRIAEGIKRVRDKQIKVAPGYDGEYGVIDIFDREKKEKKQQFTLF
ncbi:MAG: endonuclease Q family protein [Candidatus Omnitrophota bacterium]